jgi:hypothetical protein
VTPAYKPNFAITGILSDALWWTYVAVTTVGYGGSVLFEIGLADFGQRFGDVGLSATALAEPI